IDDRLFFYGFHWWLGRSLVQGREIPWAAGIGLGGQRLFVVPALSLVVVITAGHYADAKQSWVPLVVLNRYVLGALVSAFAPPTSYDPPPLAPKRSTFECVVPNSGNGSLLKEAQQLGNDLRRGRLHKTAISTFPAASRGRFWIFVDLYAFCV